MLRHLGRLTCALDQALAQDRLSQSTLAMLQASRAQDLPLASLPVRRQAQLACTGNRWQLAGAMWC